MLRPGRRLAVDVGKARIGLAITDIHAILASPLATVTRATDNQVSIAEVLTRASEQGDLLEIYVGVPVNLQGLVTESTKDAVEFAEQLGASASVEVFLVDERMTTSIANSQLLEIGKSQKSARSTIDQMAAVAILEYALTVEKNSSQRPGLTISQWRDKYE
ncbi:MAG: Holliday junction resolvase RuvX [Rhodoluna sp.]|nr:Holliday junction resolvase RuvX [Rhodoluna sp.]